MLKGAERDKFIRKYFIVRDKDVILKKRERRDFFTRTEQIEFNEKKANTVIGDVYEPFTTHVVTPRGRERVVSGEIFMAYAPPTRGGTR